MTSTTASSRPTVAFKAVRRVLSRETLDLLLPPATTPAQPVYCRACGRQFFSTFAEESSHTSEVCNEKCWDELLWRKSLARQGRPYEPLNREIIPTKVTIAELEPTPGLDSLLEDLEDYPVIVVDRYSLTAALKGGPHEADIIKSFKNLSPRGELQFPAVTFWYESGDSSRVFGLAASLRKLKSLLHKMSKIS